MKLIWSLARYAPVTFIASIFVNALSAVAGMAAIACIFHANDPYPYIFSMFVAFGLVSIISRFIADYLISLIGRSFISKIRTDITNGMIASDLADVEKIGVSRLTRTFTSDISTVGVAVTGILFAISNMFISIACIVYLFYLSINASVFIIVSIFLGALLYYFLVKRGSAHVVQTFRNVDSLQRLFVSIAQGVSQIKLNSRARQRVVAEGHESIKSINSSFSSGYNWFAASERMIQMLSYILLGSVAFVIMYPTNETAALQYCIVLIYLFGPLLGMVQAIPSVTEADVALSRVEQLTQPFGELVNARALDASASSGGRQETRCELSFQDVSYFYNDLTSEPQGNFSLNSMSFEVRSGEVVFIVGGNGSGKTTTAKLLTGLYSPDAGEIRLNGVLIDKNNLAWYSEHFCATFQDHFVFEWMMPEYNDPNAAKMDEWIQRLDLVDRIDRTKMSTERLSQLSAGEKRRLTLLASILEDRPIYVFDEWAADQQPEMRAYFYENVIRELLEKGKLVVVITHDERYFGMADKLIRLERGEHPQIK